GFRDRDAPGIESRRVVGIVEAGGSRTTCRTHVDAVAGVGHIETVLDTIDHCPGGRGEGGSAVRVGSVLEAHRYGGLSQVDHDGRVSFGTVVVRVTGEGPVSRSAGDAGEAGAQIQQAGQILTVDAGGRAGGAVRLVVKGSAVTVHSYRRRGLV